VESSVTDPGVTEPVVSVFTAPVPGEPAITDEPLVANAPSPPFPFNPPPSDGPGNHPPPPKMPNNRGFVATILSTFVFFISLAVAVTITLYSIGDSAASGDEQSNTTAEEAQSSTTSNMWSWWNEWKHIGAPVAGIIVSLVGSCLFALYNREYSQPDRVDPQLYGELRARLGSLDALLPVLCPASGPVICDHPSGLTCKASCNEAWARRDFINDELESRGSRWVLGSGFIDLYRQLHAAEEALFIVLPTSDVVGNALYDDLRLNGADATILDSSSLRTNLRAALPLIGASRVQILTSPPVPVDPPTPPPTSLSLEDRALGRVILRDIRRAISEFRDSERANLVRARNQLVWTGTITAIAGYALLALAILAKAPLQAVMSGVVYYVVGATVGLFDQLRIDRDREGGEEDFGFSRARLFYVPVLSGLAAVGGVMVVALLNEAIYFRAGEQQRSLHDIFNIRNFSLGLVIAAVFGLTPSLLVDRLSAKARDYRKALTLTSATTTGVHYKP
jgi:hypothetical protein